MKNNDKEAKYIAGCDPYTEPAESYKLVIWDTEKGTFEDWVNKENKTPKQLTEEQEFYRQQATAILKIKDDRI